jgi:chromosome partitioning protein
MPQVLAVANQKGGTGKTTVATSLAAAFANQHGLTTLLIDMDGQCNATAAVLGSAARPRRTIKDVLWHAIPLAEVMVACPHHERLLVVAGSAELSYYEKVISPEQWDDVVQEARQILVAGLPDEVDVVVIDTPPSLGLWLNAALAASDGAIVVCEPGKFSLDGITQLMQTFTNLKATANPALDLTGFVVNKLRAGVGRHDDYLAAFRAQFGALLLEPPIHVRIVIDDCQRAGTPLEFYQDRAAPELRASFGQIAAQVMARRGVAPVVATGTPAATSAGTAALTPAGSAVAVAPAVAAEGALRETLAAAQA